jgi:copper transport protein
MAAAACLAPVMVPAAASAHAVFVSAYPAPGASLARPPDSVRIVFTEPLVAALSGIRLLSPSGTVVAARAAGIDPSDRSAYQVRLPPLRPGRYTVVWHTTSAIDGHTRWGSYGFTVLAPGGRQPPPGQLARSPLPLPGTSALLTALQAGASWLGLAGLFLVTGALLMLALQPRARTPSEPGKPGESGGLGKFGESGELGEPARRALAWLLTAGAAAGTAGVAAQFWTAWAAAIPAAPAAAVFTEGAARWWWLRLAGAVAVLAARPRAGRQIPAWLLAFAAATVTAQAVSFAGAGHGAAAAGQPAGLAIVAVHVLAGSMWLGGVAGLAALWAVSHRQGIPPAALRTLLRRYSVTAGMAVPAVAATGLASALLEAGRIGDLTGTGYGRALLAKLALAGLAGLAALGSLRAHGPLRGEVPLAQRPKGEQQAQTAVPSQPAAVPSQPSRWFRAGLRLETGLGLLILVPTAAMSVLAPPGPAEALRSAARQIAAGSDPAASFTGESRLGTRDLEVSLTPGGTGPNAVRAEVDGNLRAARLSIVLSGPGGAGVTAWLQRAGTDHDPRLHTLYAGALSLGRPGDWQAIVRGPGGASQPVVVPVRAATWQLPARARGPASAQATAGADGTAGAQGTTGAYGTAGAPEMVAWPQPATGLGRRARWLLIILAAGASVMVLAGARGLRRRRWQGATVALGGTGCLVAAGCAGLLALAPAAAVPGAPAAAVPGAPAAAVPGAAAADGPGQPVAPVTAGGVAVWPVGGPDAGLMMPAVAPDGTVWVGEMSAGRLAALSPGGRVRQVALPGGYKEVMGLAVDRRGRIWVAEEHAQSLGMFDPAANRYRQYRIPGADPAPVGVAVDTDGNVWFTEMNGDRIGRFDPVTGRFAQFRLHVPGALPYWLAIAPDGRVWFTEFGTGRAGVLAPATGRIREYRLPGRQTPTGIAIGASGTPWLVTTQGSLLRLNPGSGKAHQLRAPVANLYGVAVTGDSTVWLGTASGDFMYAYSPQAGRFRRWRLPVGQAPWWVAADGGHRVWAALGGAAAGGLAELAAPGTPR